ncbi:MAG: hypothetical protein HY262_04345 [Chloroflexi bacterium]|nr:hypothetical protein [Chloroflexota bacterium]
MDRLEADYRRIAHDHHRATLRMTARSSLPSSVTRVFQATTKDALVPLLATLPVDSLPRLKDEDAFRRWFMRSLDTVAACVLTLNPPEVQPRIHPGYKWGHSTKVLALFVRDLVLFSRYFSDSDVETIVPWLYCPVDTIVLDRLRRLGERPGATRIKRIETGEQYWRIQDRLGAVASKVGVPRVWFDDIWGDRVPVSED